MKLPYFLLIGLFTLLAHCSLAQEIHSVAEILKIMEESQVSYEINILSSVIPDEDRSGKLNYHIYYRKLKDGNLLTYQYERDSSLEVLISRAESLFADKKYAEAQQIYLDVVSKDSTAYDIMVYIGQIYGIQGDFAKEASWYEKVIGLNYIDYMAHWFLADNYLKQGRKKDALKEISIAQVLNRNNPRVHKSLTNIFDQNGLNVKEWAFTPQIMLDSTDDNHVKISYSNPWLGYAMAKAVWKYEPGYRVSMGIEGNNASTTEERECLAALLSSVDKKQMKKDPIFLALNYAIDKEMVNEYIFYEILLPKYPVVVNQLPQTFIEEIANYLVEVRGSIK